MKGFIRIAVVVFFIISRALEGTPLEEYIGAIFWIGIIIFFIFGKDPKKAKETLGKIKGFNTNIKDLMNSNILQDKQNISPSSRSDNTLSGKATVNTNATVHELDDNHTVHKDATGKPANPYSLDGK